MIRIKDAVVLLDIPFTVDTALWKEIKKQNIRKKKARKIANLFLAYIRRLDTYIPDSKEYEKCFFERWEKDILDIMYPKKKTSHEKKSST